MATRSNRCGWTQTSALSMTRDIDVYNQNQAAEYAVICTVLQKIIDSKLGAQESKIWHGGPVWFIDENPVAGYWVHENKKQGKFVRLMFWSGMSFDEPRLEPGTGKFKDAHIDYMRVDEIDESEVSRWLQKSQKIQWDYKNIVKNKGNLERLT